MRPWDKESLGLFTGMWNQEMLRGFCFVAFCFVFVFCLLGVFLFFFYVFVCFLTCMWSQGIVWVWGLWNHWIFETVHHLGLVVYPAVEGGGWHWRFMSGTLCLAQSSCDIQTRTKKLLCEKFFFLWLLTNDWVLQFRDLLDLLNCLIHLSFKTQKVTSHVFGSCGQSCPSKAQSFRSVTGKCVQFDLTDIVCFLQESKMLYYLWAERFHLVQLSSLLM